MTTVLVAGATGAVGTALVPHLRAQGFDVIPHVRPKTAPTHALGKDPQALIIDLSGPSLDAAMARVDAVVCLVGTMRRRFAAGDTYQSSDYLPVKLLAESARRVPAASPRRFILLSSLGARPGAGYLGWKHKAEQAARDSGLPLAILRPSFLDSTRSGSHASDGTQRKPPPIIGALLSAVGADDWRPMPVEVLCRAIAALLREPLPQQAVLQGRDLWRLAQGPAPG